MHIFDQHGIVFRLGQLIMGCITTYDLINGHNYDKFWVLFLAERHPHFKTTVKQIYAHKTSEVNGQSHITHTYLLLGIQVSLGY